MNNLFNEHNQNQLNVQHAITGNQKPRSYEGDYMDIGKQGEEIIINWLKQRPNILGINDFRKIREVHESDIDIALRLYSGQVCLAEIKTDTYLGVTGNILSEILRINHYAKSEFAGYLGWTFRSPAQYLLLYAPNRKPPAIYKTLFTDFRLVLQRFAKNNGLPKFCEVRTDEIKTTYNILISEDEYEGVFEIYEI